MTKIKQIKPAPFLGAKLTDPKVYGSKVEEIIEQVNRISNTDGSITATTITTTGAITSAGGVVTDTISEKTAGKGITLSNPLVKKNTLTALNTTGTLTAAAINKGGITSTSAAAVTATLDSVANLVAQLGVTAGTMVDFIVDNTAGSNTVTVAVPAGIVVAKQTSNGDTAVDQLLTVAASATVGVGLFKLYFQSTSAAVLFRAG